MTPEELYVSCYRRFALFERIYDGDTVFLSIDMGDYLWQLERGIRIYGIDTPEIRPRIGTALQKTREKPAGIEARDRANALLQAAEGPLVVQTIKRPGKKLRDKYGRVLGRILIPISGIVIDLNQRLLVERHARPYMGGKKLPWDPLRELNIQDPTPQEVAASLLSA